MVMSAYKVGMSVIGNDKNTYPITGMGCIGRVTAVYPDEELIEIQVGGHSYRVKANCFDIIPDGCYYNFKISENMLRNLFGCPEGYVIEIEDNDYNPYTIEDDEMIDKDGDSYSLYNFLDMLEDSCYRIVKIDDQVEMTMDEICKALGKNIKIVKEKNND